MIANVHFFAGAVTCSCGGALAISTIRKYCDKVFENVSPFVKTAVPSCALLVTVDAVAKYAEEASPFWKGVAWAVPTLAVLTAEVIGMTGAEVALARKNPDVFYSDEYKEQMCASDWKHSLAFATTVCITSRLPKDCFRTFAGLFGSILGNLKVMRAADLAQDMRKKIN